MIEKWTNTHAELKKYIYNDLRAITMLITYSKAAVDIA